MSELTTLDWVGETNGGESGNAVTDFLFPAPAPRTAKGIIGWWERRRLHFNAIVGGTGLVSLGAFKLLTSLPPDPHSIIILMGPIVAYGVLANLCYFLGPAVEITLEKLSKGSLLPTGPVLFRMGLTFSVGLTLLPVLVGALDWVTRLLGWLF